MKTQYEPVSEDDFEFLYKKEYKDESLLPDYIGILFSISIVVFLLSFYDISFNPFDYLNLHLFKFYYL